MAFDTAETTYARVLTSEASGAVVKCPYEKLELGPAGKPDTLTLYYEAVCEDENDLNAFLLSEWTIGDDISTAAVTAGTWITERPSIVSKPEGLPFAQYAVRCVGLAQSKVNATRWFGTSESQTGQDILYSGTVWPTLQAEQLSIGVEIDTVVIGAQPAMNTVGTNVTPPSPPSVRANVWTSLVDPTRHYPDGWVLVDIRSEQIAGLSTAWLATYVYRYKYALSP